jgi:hypothetical protein
MVAALGWYAPNDLLMELAMILPSILVSLMFGALSLICLATLNACSLLQLLGAAHVVISSHIGCSPDDTNHAPHRSRTHAFIATTPRANIAPLQLRHSLRMCCMLI